MLAEGYKRDMVRSTSSIADITRKLHRHMHLGDERMKEKKNIMSYSVREEKK
jgi:hypothetical protein